MPEEQDVGQRDEDHFLDEGALQRVDRAVDQVAPVVGRRHRHPRGQPRRKLRELFLHPADHLLCVLAVPHDDDSTDDLALPVLLQQPAPARPAHLHHAEVLHIDRRPGNRGRHDDVLHVLPAPKVPAASDLVLHRVAFDHVAADLPVGAGDGCGHGPDGDAVREQLHRVEVDLVLPLEAADRRHLGDSRHRLERVPQVPVLDRPQLAQVVPVALQGVPVDVPHPRAVGPEDRDDSLGQAVADLVQPLQHPAAGPIEVHRVLEDDVDHRRAEHRRRADGPHVRQSLEVRRQRVGHLVLDDLRRPSFPHRVDDDLVVGKVRDGVDGRAQQRPRPPEEDREGAQDRQEPVPQARRYDAVDHLPEPPTSRRAQRAGPRIRSEAGFPSR